MEKRIRVVICSGTACYVMGGSDLLLLEENLPAGLRDRVEIEGSNCLGFCRNAGSGKAPYVTIDGELMSAATLPMVIQRIREICDAEHQ
jgi:NADH:ubiquinone oxidoreductase 24 kD subunit